MHERLTRAAISELPDGTFDFEDWLDDDGIDLGQPFPSRSRSTKKAISLSPIGQVARRR